MSKFSAFRLFYDQFIYKRNILIHYDLIERNILKIRESLFSVLNTYEGDRELYQTKLNRSRSRIKTELERIYELEPKLFRVYYDIYKERIDSNDKMKDLPFIISCSFYEDYKIGGNINNRISKYSSKDKKMIRDEAKSLGFILFFIKVLKSINEEQYNKLIQLLLAFYNKNINLNIGYLDNQGLFIKDKCSIIRTCKREMTKAKLSLDYKYIYDQLDIAYRIKDKEVEEILEEELDKYFTYKYQDALREDQLLLDSTLYHVIPYEDVVQYINEEKEQYNIYEKEYKENKKVNIKTSRFANNVYQELVKYFYNSRIKVYEEEQYNMQRVVSSLLQLDNLYNEIPVRIFKYILFNASYSSNLNRNKNERYYIISNIYELYSPYKILDYYENSRKEIDDIIYHLGDKFKTQLEYELLTNNLNIYPVPSKKNILDKLKDIEYKFIIDNYRENLTSETNEYDTRNYDLFVIDSDLSINKMVSLYKDIMIDIDSLDISKEDKELLIKNVTHYVSMSILNKSDIKYDKDDKGIVNSLLKDIAIDYLNTDYIEGEVIDTKSKEKNLYEFQVLFEEYKSNSSFIKLKGEIK